jgi:Peptidase family M28
MLHLRRLVPALLALACLTTLTAAGRPAAAPIDAVSLGGLERRLHFIASDALEGRDSLSPGFRAAAEYVASELRALGLAPRGDTGSFLQRVTMRRSSVDPAGTLVEVNGEAFGYGDDLLATGRGTAAGPVIYVGHGYRVPSKGVDPFAGVDVRGAVMLVLPGLPAGVTVQDLPSQAKGRDWWGPEDNARALGAVAVVRVAGFEDLAAWPRTRERQTSRGALVVDRLAPESDDVPVVTAGPRLLAALMRGERESGARLHERASTNDAGDPFALGEKKRVTITVAARVTREDTFNVVASLEGADPVLKSELVALGAHLDHIGLRVARTGPRAAAADRSAAAQIGSAEGTAGGSAATRRDGDAADRINNGADDDGSGVVALIEIAAAALQGPRPKRSLLFVWHTGEESGGWGSRYLTAFPPVPIDRIVAQLNLDMVGRSKAPGDTAAANAGLTGPHEVYLVGATRLSRELGETIARVNREHLGLTLNPKYDDPADPERIYERSDHYQYALKGIPVAFFFSGLHEDYHRPSDEVDRIDFVKLQKIARTVLAVSWALANAPERPALDAPATR